MQVAIKKASNGAVVGGHSRFFWIWLLCLIAYKPQDNISSAVEFHQVTQNPRDRLVSLIHFFPYHIFEGVTHHGDGWGSSVVVGGMLVKSRLQERLGCPIFVWPALQFTASFSEP